MKAIVQASLRLNGRSLAHLDEDNVTLAVAAARHAMREAKVLPEQVRRLDVPPELPAQHVLAALGLPASTTAEPAAGPGLSLQIRVRSGEQAEATLEGPGLRPDETLSQAPLPRTVDAAFAERIQQAAQRWLGNVPMGANVPQRTWDAQLEERYRLLSSTCESCGDPQHPPIRSCSRCGGATRVQAHEQGILYAFTTIAKGGGPAEFDEWQALEGEYAVAIAELKPGLRVAGMLCDTDLTQLRIGQPVEAVLRRLFAQEGAWRYGTKFRALTR